MPLKVPCSSKPALLPQTKIEEVSPPFETLYVVVVSSTPSYLFVGIQSFVNFFFVQLHLVEKVIVARHFLCASVVPGAVVSHDDELKSPGLSSVAVNLSEGHVS